MQDGCAGGGEKMRGNKEREGVGTLRGPEGTLPCELWWDRGRKLKRWERQGETWCAALRVTQLGMSE